ncbi:putative protein serine/threonine kinase [Tieghemostelium lacteum]|uniref:Protein kinase domain-containing protein n=1 Tax=Tieghemostelium lacteum TaxID=361077 RepID=A0A151ZF19_TIELA|nr:putative protein serine/threonine kinase [Tieghemostelium lacteum]|eukprot:KYQ92525.1 putative protein serine/threonine kinase [Tieghemostelium lacteum]
MDINTQEDDQELQEIEQKVDDYFGGADSGELENNNSTSYDDMLEDDQVASGLVSPNKSPNKSPSNSTDDLLNTDVLAAASKFKEGQSVNSMKKNRRNFRMNVGPQLFESQESQPQQEISTPTITVGGQQPFLSPTPKTATSSGGTPPKSPGIALQFTSPSTSSKVPLYQTSPYKSSALFPNSGKVDDSSPQTIGKYQLLHHIGQGYFGNTYTGVPPDSSEYVSIKLIDKDRVNPLTLNILKNDFQVLKTLKSNNNNNNGIGKDGIVNYINLITDQTGIGVVQEFVDNGSLFDNYKRTGCFSEMLLCKYVVQILESLNFIHANGVIHRNLKANNVLLAKGGKCKISDFALGCSSMNPDPTLRYSLLAQPYWMAPEILSMKSFNSKVDSWGLGCLILECLTGQPPYFDITEPMQALVEIINFDKPVPMPSQSSSGVPLSRDLINFLSCCLKKNPMERMSSLDLIKHAWITTGQSQLAVNSEVGNRRSEQLISLDLLALSEKNEKEISEMTLISPIAVDLMKFQYQNYHSLEGFDQKPKEEQIKILKLMIDHNQTVGNNLKYQMQDSQQEQQKLYDLCQNMKAKIQEILDQNKTGARISAHSNMLLKRTNQMASDLVRKNENLHVNIKRLEDYFINKDECAKKLANVVYRHKISFESLLNPTLATNVHYQIGSKVWKKGQEKKGLATLKDNFLFFFKNEKSSVPSDVVYINDRKNLSTQIINQDSKKKAYILCIGTTIYENSLIEQTIMDDSNEQSSNDVTSQTNSNSNSNNSSNSGSDSGPSQGNTLSNSNSNPNISQSINSGISTGGTSSSSQVPAMPTFNSMSSIPTTTVWCLMAFDNLKSMENWLGLLETAVPWYDKKTNEITKIFEKKHQKQKSGDISDKKEGSGGSWKKESGGVIKFQGVFGLKIDDLMARESVGAELPYFLTKMLKFLEMHLNEEGLLRISGSSTEIQELKTSIHKGESVDYTSRDPHAVTGILKLFLRELPEPIISSESLRVYSNEIISNQRLSEKDKCKEVISILSQLPKPPCYLLKHIINFAKRVIEHQDQNKMGLANVTTCFAPSLRIAPGLFTFLIQHYDQCFLKN